METRVSATNVSQPKPGTKMVSILPKDIRKLSLMERVPTETISVQSIVDEVSHTDTPDMTNLPCTSLKLSTVKKPDHTQKTIYEAFVKVIGCRRVTVQTISSDGKVLKSSVEEEEDDPHTFNISKQEKTNESIAKFLIKKPDQYVLRDDFLGKTNFSTTMTIKCPTFLPKGKDQTSVFNQTMAPKPLKSPVKLNETETPKQSQRTQKVGENVKRLEADINFQMKKTQAVQEPVWKCTDEHSNSLNKNSSVDKKMEKADKKETIVDVSKTIKKTLSKKSVSDERVNITTPPSEDVTEEHENITAPPSPTKQKDGTLERSIKKAILDKMPTKTSTLSINRSDTNEDNGRDDKNSEKVAEKTQISSKRPINFQNTEVPIKRESKRQRKPTWKWKELLENEDSEEKNNLKPQKTKSPTKVKLTMNVEESGDGKNSMTVIKQQPEDITTTSTSDVNTKPTPVEDDGSMDNLLARAILSLADARQTSETTVESEKVTMKSTEIQTDPIDDSDDANDINEPETEDGPDDHTDPAQDKQREGEKNVEKEATCTQKEPEIVIKNTANEIPVNDPPQTSCSEEVDSKEGILQEEDENDFSIFDDDEYERRYGSRFKSTVRVHVCKFCPRKYKSRPGLLRHMRTHRKNTYETIFCEVCNKEFEKTYLYQLHLTTHEHEIEGGRHKCRFCQKAYATRSGLLKHHRTNKFCRLDKFKCEYCHSSFSNEVSLEIHRRKHLSAPKDRAHSCKKCKRTFETVGGLNKHLRNKACESSYTCEHCGKVFTNKNLFLKHIKVHTHASTKGGVCEDCGKSFSSAISLKNHRNSHLNIRNYMCSDCGKTFGQKGTLVSHRRIHTGERPYLCGTCGATFRYSCHLIQHTRSHTGEKPYGCPECQRHFSCRQSLKKHLISHANRKKKNLNNLEPMNVEVKQEYIDITNVVNPTSEEIVFLNAITGDDDGTTQYIYTTEDGQEVQGYLADGTETVVTSDTNVQYHDAQNVIYQTIEGENVTIVDEVETSDLNILAETAENYESPSVTYVIVKK